MKNAYLGPSARPDRIAALLDATGVAALDLRDDTAGLLAATVDRLAAGKVVGWFHGGMEFGPRALGARSILADPRDPSMRDRLNLLVKKREAFRPFAPSILAGHAAEHLALDHPSEFMLETCAVTSPLDLPAITHVDGSARPQTVDAATAPRYAALLEEFYRRTSCPLLVNTSFNVRDEPIVCTPLDALACLADSGIDAIVLEDFIVDREALPRPLQELLCERHDVARSDGSVAGLLYTFI
jgi:carbamoyltransferase